MPKTLSEQEIADFRDRVCDVGERLFADHGPDAVTIRQLASELGVSAMTPYRYFKDKDAILAAVRARAFDRFAQAMETAESKGFSQFEYPGQAYVDWALSHPQAYRMMFDVNQPSFAQYPELLKAMERARATMSSGMRDNPALAGKNVNLMAHVFWASMHGPIMLQLAGLLHEQMDARVLVRLTVERLIQGFKSEPFD